MVKITSNALRIAVNLITMANLAQFDLGAKSHEARVRAFLEDLVEEYKGSRWSRLALAVWFGKSIDSQDQNLLQLFSGHSMDEFVPARIPLLWKTGSQESPFVDIRATSVDHFSKLLEVRPQEVAPYQRNSEVLYFDKKLLNNDILDAFHIETEPDGLMKGWYVSSDEYARSKNIKELLSLHAHMRPNFGMVKVEESADFENCRGVLNIEISQRWLPLSPENIRDYSYFNDLQNGLPVYFLFEGGSFYRVLKFEFKKCPEYADRLLEKTRDDRYPEVYLRAMHPSAQSAA